MPIPTSIDELSQTPGDNPPDGDTDSPNTLDDHQRTAYAFIAELRDRTVAKAGDSMAGLLKFKNGANVASASIVDLTAATGNTVHITGTTAITAWTLTAGQVMDVIFDGILTLTHHATNNNLPGGVNITTAAGDRARLFYDG
ncbi:MAG: hypothetical protein KUL88_01290, partial [Rhizobium sp.]|nr:hypothetical protein [Rhizobium sp.]